MQVNEWVLQEKELKAIADKTLAEVRREITETRRALHTLEALQKLRSARKKGLEQTGS